MSQPQWLQVWHARSQALARSLKRSWLLASLEFCLPLPLLGLGFWMGSGWVAHQVLSYNYQTAQQLKADPEEVLNLAIDVTIVSIEAEINRRENFTEVQVNTADTTLKELRFEFPVTEVEAVEAAIIQELGLSPEAVQRLVRYRIDR
ncbi:hypothetical protein QQ054_02375 [Oscillatoria amoena NRMC-F 0135]|nr:hypothetical protein [Geitlerinema splendidum]MDL5044888.1 hypothetical protein [Oscillatoria amoena NRMC-F 0135]